MPQIGTVFMVNSDVVRADVYPVAARVRVFNVITKLSAGGAQETVLRYCSRLDKTRWRATLVAGSDDSPEGSLVGEANRLGVVQIVLPSLRRDVRPWADLRAFVEMVRLFRCERPDIVHTHSSKAGLLGRLAARVAGIPVIVHTVHGWSFHDDMPRIARCIAIAIERLAARWSSALVVVTRRDEEVGLEERIGYPEQYALIRSGIEVNAYDHSPGAKRRARALLGLREGVPLVGTVTRLSRQKDPSALLGAIRRVVDSRPDAHCVIVGDGPLRHAVETSVERLGLRHHVTLLGHRDDVAALLPGLDVFVLSSRWEGLPRVVVEAMAAGVPVVATDAGGVAEVVENDRSGVLVPVGDVDGLASGVLRILEEPGLGTRLAAEASRQVKQFDSTEMIDRLEDLYVRLLASVRSRPRRRRIVRAVSMARSQEAA
jgi:glycosyltransferase involved in cell wall biosynthesis